MVFFDSRVGAGAKLGWLVERWGTTWMVGFRVLNQCLWTVGGSTWRQLIVMWRKRKQKDPGQTRMNQKSSLFKATVPNIPILNNFMISISIHHWLQLYLLQMTWIYCEIVIPNTFPRELNAACPCLSFYFISFFQSKRCQALAPHHAQVEGEWTWWERKSVTLGTTSQPISFA